MSETTEIVEITDSSIYVERTLEESNVDTSKRRLSDELTDSVSAKKFCGADSFESSSLVVEPTVIENSTDVDLSEVDNIDTSNKEKDDAEDLSEINLNAEKTTDHSNKSSGSECMLEEVPVPVDAKYDKVEAEKENDNQDENDEYYDDEEHENLSDTEGSSEDNDEDLIARSMKACINKKVSNTQNDEPIALDDTDDEVIEEEEEEEEDHGDEEEEELIRDESDEDEEEIEDEEDSMEYPEASLKKRMLRYNPRFFIARMILKKSMRILSKRKNMKTKLTKENEENECDKKKLNNSPDEKISFANEQLLEKKETSEKSESNKLNELPEKIIATTLETSCTSTDEKVHNPLEKTEKSDNFEHKILSKDLPQQNSPAEKSKQAEVVVVAKVDKVNDISEQIKGEKESNENKSNSEQSNGIDLTKPADANSNQNEYANTNLLNEISNHSVEEIMNRYVLRITEQSSSAAPTLEEFSEELFYCLQQNKQEIHKAQQLWNEKLHLKYKIREIMERIRRHKAVIEIETFGYKPQESNVCNLMVSSKSSTTTNSENEHYDKSSRMSSESVNRLIQDVRANVLKREDKQRIEELSASINMGESFSDCNAFNLHNLSQANQGRQGQIIDVQSIINDFRQKNPQEIPRRGRRMKNSFGNNFFIENQIQSQLNKSDKSNSATDFNNSIKSNYSHGFPEVSLLPVNNFYKNISNAAGTSQYGPKSSLLQSILTKQSTKSPIGLHLNNSSGPPSSTLARLLTAPERSFQSTPRQAGMSSSMKQSSKMHNNGEITITPIAGTSKKQDYSMDDEENSTEPPLVIDEAEDFEVSDRTRSDLLCQGCRRNKALFMCAGCSRQWYCSKECQELAWDDHAESCMV